MASRMAGASRRTALIGLDGAAPELLFERLEDELPTLGALRRRALWGPLRSVVPPITVPAWSCMLSGRTPGELGVYGFRNRRSYTYDGLALANSTWIQVPRLWDLVSGRGGASVVLGVPGTYPPTPVRGCMVSCFMAPSTEQRFTHPAGLQAEIQRLTGGYILDVAEFRSAEPATIAQRLHDMTEQRFALARHLATSQPWDFLGFVDMGTDRLHHAFWQYCDPAHPLYEPGNPLEHVFRDYYRALDRHLAGFLEVLPDDAVVVLASDHGAQAMQGGFRVNQWLVEQGLLALREPVRPGRLDLATVDWARTTAWAEGGYYSRVFLNVAGREPQGSVPAHHYERVRDELAAALEALADDRGRPMGTRAHRPEGVYPEVRGVAPDLIVYFGDLRWRAIASFDPQGGLYTMENDTGADGANHSEDGVLLMAGEGIGAGRLDGMALYDVAPTLQTLLGLPRQPGQQGKVLL